MRGNSSAVRYRNPGPEHSLRTVLVASAVAVLAAVGLVVAVAAPVATVAGVFVLGATGRLTRPVVEEARRRLRRDARQRRVCVPYAGVCVEV